MRHNFGLEIIEEMECMDSTQLKELKTECDEIVKVMSSYKKKMSDQNNNL